MVGSNLKPGHKVKIIDYRVDTARVHGWNLYMDSTIGREGRVVSFLGAGRGYEVKGEGFRYWYAPSNLKDLEVK